MSNTTGLLNSKQCNPNMAMREIVTRVSGHLGEMGAAGECCNQSIYPDPVSSLGSEARYRIRLLAGLGILARRGGSISLCLARLRGDLRLSAASLSG